jgi:hypothetical protein
MLQAFLETKTMAEAVQIAEDTATDIVALVEQDPSPFLVDKDARRAFMDQVRDIALTAGDDVTTAKSRAAIVAMAAKVTKCKTTIDNAGKAMTEEWRKKTAEVNEARREVRDDFTQLAADVRRPVTEWEEAEKARQERADSTLRELQALIQSPAPMGASVETVEERLAEVKQIEIDATTFGDDAGFAEKLRAEAIEAVSGALESLKKAEAERAELEALRREKEEREAREQAEREAAEVKAREEAEAKARAEREAEEAKRREAEAQRRAEGAAERARQEERERIEAERRAEEEARAKAAAEAERKAQNKRHRARILAEVAEALETQFSLSGGQSQLIADAIASGHIPHTSVQF